MKLLACALEASANLHLEKILKADSRISFFNSSANVQNPSLHNELFGIFDTAKFDKTHAYCDYHEFNAMGFIEVLPLIFKAKRAIKELVRTAISECIDTVIAIDSPAFNIPLIKALRKAGFKGRIIYFILPQVWAWKKARVKKLEPLCDELVGILPFERDYWGHKFSYFGNPITASVAPYLRTQAANKINNDAPIIAFLPGSRRREIASLMPIFRQLAVLILAKYPNAKLLLSCVNKSADYGDSRLFQCTDDALKAVSNADFAYVCSGTASLQTALIGTPFALVYKARSLDYFIAKSFVDIKYIGLANIIITKSHHESIHAEYIQNFSANELFSELERSQPERFYERSKELRNILGELKLEEISKLIYKEN